MSVSLYGNGQTVIQVVSVPFTTGYSYSVASGTNTDTAITATITPQSTNSKILVQISCTVGMAYTNANIGVYTAIKRNSTVITNYFGLQINSATNGEALATVPYIHYLDSPATTSATTYTLQVSGSGSTTAYVNRNYAVSSGFQAVITLMEISGS